MRGISLLVFVLLGLNANSANLEVCPNCEMSSLRKAVKTSQPFDVIWVRKGVYIDHGLIIDKPLTIIGEEGSIIDGNAEGEILTLRADSVIIKGLTFRNVGLSYTKDWAAISSDNVAHCRIEDNSFERSFFGIYLRKSSYCVVSGNKMNGEAVAEMTSGNAIHFWYCNNMRVENNIVERHRDGIYFEFVKHSLVQGNLSRNNVRYGLHFMFSDNDQYLNNTFENNGSGVAVMYSSFIKMNENKFLENWGPASFGLLLKEIKDGEILGNTFYRNTTAIFAEGAMRMRISNNTFTYNGWAMKILSSCMENEIHDNDFISNSFSVYTNSSRSYNNFDENYWSEYSGYDLDRDGFGDVPHRPVSLFTFIVEQCEPALLLMRSHFIGLLEMAEKAAPSITPEALVDHNPRMKPLWP